MNEDTDDVKIDRGRRFHRRTRSRWWFILIIALAIPFLLFTGIWAFRRPIVTGILFRVNEGLPGTISIEDGSITWRRFFTRLSLTLDNTVLVDHRNREVIRSNLTAVVINPLALLQRRIDVESLILSGVHIELAIDEKGELNLYDALGIASGSGDDEEIDSVRKDESQQTWRRWGASISDIRFEDCRAVLISDGGRASAHLEYLDLDLFRDGADGVVELALALSDVGSEGLGPGYFRGKRYTLNLAIDVIDKVAVIRTGNLGIQGADVDVAGNLALYYPFEANLGISAHGTDTDLLLTFLPPGISLGDVIPVGNGSIGIDGSVSGPLTANPEIAINISCEDFGMQHVPSGLVMDRIGFRASARKADGPMRFVVWEFGARLPDGSFRGNLALENLKQPQMAFALEASLDLRTLVSFFVFPGSESIKGQLDIDMNIAGKLSGNGKLLAVERETGNVRLTDFHYFLSDSHYGMRDLDMVFKLRSGSIEVQSLHASTSAGDIGLSGSFGDIWPLILGGDGPLIFGLSLTSPAFNLSPLFKDPVVAASWNKNMEDLELAFSFTTSTTAIRARDPLARGVFRIDNLVTRIPASGRELSRFSGEILIDDRFKGSLEGQLNDSEVAFEVDIDGYRGLLVKEISDSVSARVRLSAPALIATDILPVQTLEESSWVGRGLQDLYLDLELIFQNSDWFSSPGGWPDGQWRLHELRGTTTGNGQKYSISFDLQSSEGKVDLNRLSGKVGDSVFTAVGNLENASALFLGTSEKISGSLTLNSRYLNMADIFRITDAKEVPDTDYTESSNPEDEPFELNVDGASFPDVALKVNIEDFRMQSYHWKNLGGSVIFEPEGVVVLENLRLDGSVQGWIRMNGQVDFSREDKYLLDAELEIHDMNLGITNVPLSMGEDSFSFGDVIKGILSGDVHLFSEVNPDLSINLDDSRIEVKADLLGGRLIDFPPFIAIGEDKGIERMRDVRLADLTLKANLQDGILSIPKTAVGSTLGYLELEGNSRMSGYMSYSVTIPNSVLDEIVSGMVFGNFGKGDDEIITAENTGRNRTTVNVVGSSEDFIIGIGKRGRPRLERRWERRNPGSDEGDEG